MLSEAKPKSDHDLKSETELGSRKIWQQLVCKQCKSVHMFPEDINLVDLAASTDKEGESRLKCGDCRIDLDPKHAELIQENLDGTVTVKCSCCDAKTTVMPPHLQASWTTTTNMM